MCPSSVVALTTILQGGINLGMETCHSVVVELSFDLEKFLVTGKSFVFIGESQNTYYRHTNVFTPSFRIDIIPWPPLCQSFYFALPVILEVYSVPNFSFNNYGDYAVGLKRPNCRGY